MKKIRIKDIVKLSNDLDMMGHINQADLLDGVIGLLLGGPSNREGGVIIINDEIEDLGRGIGDSLYDGSGISDEQVAGASEALNYYPENLRDFVDGIEEGITGEEVYTITTEDDRGFKIKNDILKDLSPEDIHNEADKLKIKWDDNKKFMNRCKELVGKKHLDDMSQEELEIILLVLKNEKFYFKKSS